MHNYKITIQYDGTHFSGWQIQNNAVTVQDEIRKAVNTITREEVNLIGSGRTDSGVHALGQVANFQLTTEIDPYRFLNSVNAIIPNDITVTNICEAKESFHSRFDATKRSYIYIFNTQPSPFLRKFSSYIPDFHKLYNIKQLNDISKFLLGEHNFTSLSKKNDEVPNKLCTIFEIGWRKNGQFIIFYIQGNRFLRGMVRIVTGTMLEASLKDKPLEYLEKLIKSENNENAGTAVEAKGLFLYKVKY